MIGDSRRLIECVSRAIERARSRHKNRNEKCGGGAGGNLRVNCYRFTYFVFGVLFLFAIQALAFSVSDGFSLILFLVLVLFLVLFFCFSHFFERIDELMAVEVLHWLPCVVAFREANPFQQVFNLFGGTNKRQISPMPRRIYSSDTNFAG